MHVVFSVVEVPERESKELGKFLLGSKTTARVGAG
jgi:hypothetical protein